MTSIVSCSSLARITHNHNLPSLPPSPPHTSMHGWLHGHSMPDAVLAVCPCRIFQMQPNNCSPPHFGQLLSTVSCCAPPRLSALTTRVPAVRQLWSHRAANIGIGPLLHVLVFHSKGLDRAHKRPIPTRSAQSAAKPSLFDKCASLLSPPTPPCSSFFLIHLCPFHMPCLPSSRHDANSSPTAVSGPLL